MLLYMFIKRHISKQIFLEELRKLTLKFILKNESPLIKSPLISFGKENKRYMKMLQGRDFLYEILRQNQKL